MYDLRITIDQERLTPLGWFLVIVNSISLATFFAVIFFESFRKAGLVAAALLFLTMLIFALLDKVSDAVHRPKRDKPPLRAEDLDGYFDRRRDDA